MTIMVPDDESSRPIHHCRLILYNINVAIVRDLFRDNDNNTID